MNDDLITRPNRPDEGFHYPNIDGYTLPGYLDAVPGLHPALRFRYRPVTPEERIEIIQITEAKPAKVARKMLAQLLADRLSEWNVPNTDAAKSESGESEPITPQFLESFKFPPWNRLLGIIIYSSDVSDIDPEWSRDDRELNDGKENIFDRLVKN